MEAQPFNWGIRTGGLPAPKAPRESMAAGRERAARARHRSPAEALAANLQQQGDIPDQIAWIREEAERDIEKVRQEEAELKRREAELRKLLSLSPVGIGDMPTTVLTSILLTGTHDNLLRHVSRCAQVCPEWRRLAMGSAAYGLAIVARAGGQLTAAEERARVLGEISGALDKAERELDLHSTKIGDAGALALEPVVRALGKKKKLAIKELTLSDCGLSAEGTAPIARLLRNGLSRKRKKGLRDLWIHHNQLGDDGVTALAGALPPSLSRLYVGKCGMEDEGMIALVRKLPSTRIRHLDCSVSPAVGPQGWEALGAALPQLPLLVNLELNDNTSLGNAGARALARGLPEAAKLREVYLPDCAIGTEGAAALAAVLPRCKALALLSLRGNPISAAGQTALRAAAAQAAVDSTDPVTRREGTVAVTFYDSDTDDTDDTDDHDGYPSGSPDDY